MKTSFEFLKGIVGAFGIVGVALLIIGGISGIVMTAANIIFGYMSSLTTVSGTILIFCTIAGLLCYMVSDGLAGYVVDRYPNETEDFVNNFK